MCTHRILMLISRLRTSRFDENNQMPVTRPPVIPACTRMQSRRASAPAQCGLAGITSVCTIQMLHALRTAA